MKKEKISVVIITNNESKNIERCLISVAWADEKLLSIRTVRTTLRRRQKTWSESF